MSLIAVTDADRIRAAFARLTKIAEAGGQPVECPVEWQGGSGERTIYWHPDVGVWALHEEADSLYWVGFGTSDPTAPEREEGSSLSPAFLIGLPREGVDRLRTGVFAHETSNNWTFVCHSGNLSGGKPGVAKTRFLKFHGDYHQSLVHWPDGTKHSYILIGALEDDDLLERMAFFARQADEFKSSTAKK